MRLPSVPPQLRNTILYLGTVILAQLAGFLLLPVITRFLAPSAYGEYVLALAVMSLIGMIGSSWVRNVGFRFYFDAKNAGATRAFFWSMAGLQVVLLLVASIIGILLLPRLSASLVPIPTLLAAATMVLASDFQALTVSFIRAEKLSGRYAVAELSAASTRLLGTSAGLAAGLTHPAFLFLAAAFASTIGGFVAMQSLTPKLTGAATTDRRMLASVLRLAPSALPYSVGQWLGRLSDRLVLNAYASTAVVGIYGAGFSLSDRIIGGFVEAVFMMAWPDVLSSWNDGGVERARIALRRYFQIFLWLTVGPTVALVAFGAAVVSIFLGSEYQAAVQVLGLIGTAAWLRGLRRGLNRHFELQKRYLPLSLMTIAGSVLNLILNLVLVPRYLALGAGIAALATQVVMTAVYAIIRDRRLVWFPWADVVTVSAATAAVAAAAYAALGTSVNGFVAFAVGYAVVTAAVWTVRVRRGWSADG